MSRRFMQLLSDFVSPDEQEIYSIDECFLDLSSYAQQYDLEQYVHRIVERVKNWLGLPVSIGIGRSKTEAKLANHFAKQHLQFKQVCNLLTMDPCALEQLYLSTAVQEVWGVGRKQGARLNQLDIHNVFDLATANPERIRQQFSVVLQRTVLELQGISCLDMQQVTPHRQQIIASRSFGQRIQQLDELKEALNCYLLDAVTRLRSQQLYCGHLIVFAQSDPYDTKQSAYYPSLSYALPEATDNLLLLSKLAMQLLEKLYRPDVSFKKCGVCLTDLLPPQAATFDLFSDQQSVESEQQLMQSLSAIHEKFGKEKLALGASRFSERKWHMSCSQLSPNYFRWGQLLKI